MDTHLAIFLMLITASIGGGIGYALRRRADAKRIAALEGQRNDAHDEMVEQEWCCDRVTALVAQLLDYQGREWQQMVDEGELHTLRLTNDALGKVARRWKERALAHEKKFAALEREEWGNADASGQAIVDNHLAQPPVNDIYADAERRHSGSLQ